MSMRIFYNNILFIADDKRETSAKIVCRRRAEKSDESERESY